MSRELDLRLTAAAAVGREAGQLARELFERGVPAKFKSPQDYVTEADARVEAFIRSRLNTLFPDDAVVGEETGGEPGRRTWIIDPIDGTANFAHGVPQFGVSIGLVEQGRPVLGVVYLPTRDHLYTARSGGGCFRNGRPIHASACADPATAYVEIGCSPRSDRAHYLRLLESVLDAGILVRWSGSAVLSLVQVAEGSSDGYCELFLNPWDVAAGIVLVTEAGGWTSDFFAGSGPYGGRPLLACGAAFRGTMTRICSEGLRGTDLLDPGHGISPLVTT